MADFRKWFYALALVALITGLTIPASAQVSPFTCAAQSSVTPTIRVEGYTEQVGDLLLVCSGGTPTSAGAFVPAANITLVANTNITSKLTAGTFDDALLIIDEPNSPGPNSNRPILNCGAVGAPDTSVSSGPGVCGIFSDGNPVDTYNGASGVVGTFTGTLTAGASVACTTANPVLPGVQVNPLVGPGAAGTNATFGCGRPNVFQGREGTVFNPGQFNAVTFNGVPIDPPGTSGTRTLRFTNIRVDAEFLQVASTFTPSTVTLSVSTNGATSAPINITSQVVAIIAHGLVQLNNGAGGISNPRLNFVQCTSENPKLSSSTASSISNSTTASYGGNSQFTAGGIATISFQEGFAGAWKPKNISYVLANGTANGAGQGYTYNGAAIVIAPGFDYAQNVPGAIYETESGFEFPSLASVPSPNPPTGVGTTVVTGSTGAGAQAFNDGNNGVTSTGISTAGIVTQGTRLAVSLSNVPQGVSVWTQPILYLYRIGSGGSSITGASASGVMVLVTTDAQGDTPITFASTNNNLIQIPSNNLAVWEVLFSDASTSEEVDIPLVVSYVSNLSANLPNGLPAPNQIAQATGSFAPFYGGSYSPNPRVPVSTSSLPVPRFVPGTTPLNAFEVDRCACNLLFPFITNQSGFDTGLAIANTSTDPGAAYGFNSTGAQEGTVTFFYYGVGNNGAAQPAPQTSAVVPSGQVLTYDVFSGLGAIGNSANGLNASAAGFQGYIIAQAQFQYCHGYAFVSALGIGPTGQGVSEGYLGIVLDRGGLPRTLQIGENDAH